MPSPAMPHRPSHCTGFQYPYGYTFTSQPVTSAAPAAALFAVSSRLP